VPNLLRQLVSQTTLASHRGAPSVASKIESIHPRQLQEAMLRQIRKETSTLKTHLKARLHHRGDRFRAGPSIELSA
jgi:hypothetical protein